MITLPALSIRQPWVWAILHAGKDVENRTWPTPRRGRFLIHASKSHDDPGWDECRQIAARTGHALPRADQLQYGGIVGVAEIVDCVPLNNARSSFNGNPWAFGPWCFRLANARTLEFLPQRGYQNFFTVHVPEGYLP